MKLKQRLILAPILIFIFLVTKPLWSDGDDQPWSVRQKFVGPVHPRNSGINTGYVGPFHDASRGPDRSELPNRPYPVNQPVIPPYPNVPVNPPYQQPVAPVRPVSVNVPVYQKPVQLPVQQVVQPVAPKVPAGPMVFPVKPNIPVPVKIEPVVPKIPRKLPAVAVPESPHKPQSQNSAKKLPSKEQKLIVRKTTKKPETESRSTKKIPAAQKNLPLPTMNPGARKKFVEEQVAEIQVNLQMKNSNDPWKLAADWIRPRSIIPAKHQALGSILNALTTSKIMKADILTKGTQLKILLFLQGNQRVIFKPKRYEREHIIQGKAYDGYDRHNGEIAAFHLDRILGFRRAPIVVGRKINLDTEILPIAAERLSKTFKKKNQDTCFYGQCYYCKEAELACGQGSIMEGSITLWLPDDWSLEKIRHPYQRTYVDDKKARWEDDDQYCNKYVKMTAPYDKGPRLLDLMDTTVFDFMIGNADRHHYEIFAKKPDPMVLLLDNAKSFGNPHHDELSILAPLKQCCLLRKSTFDRLVELRGGLMTKLLIEATKNDPISPILHKKHIEAINRRMPIVFQTLMDCVRENGKDNVITDTWAGES